MVKYSCQRCGKDFSQKSHYDSHNRRKTPCENNSDKIKQLVDKAVEEKIKELNNNNKLIVENEVKQDNNEILTKNNDNIIKKEETSQLRVLDLFCGCGGMSKGLEDAGLNIVAGLDIWDKAIDSYTQNFDHLSVCEDISKLTPESFDTKYKIGKDNIELIVGGPPCQGFSIAGKRDKKDPRNSLFMEYVKYLNYFTPKAFILENVMGILSMKNSSNIKVIDIIMEELNKNYKCIICKLYASDFEVPQNRRRVIVIGIRKDLNIIPTEPTAILTKENRVPVSTIILPKNEVNAKYYLSEKALNGIKAKREKAKQNGNGFGAQFLKMDKPSYTIPARYWKDGYDALVAYSDTEVRRLTILELKRIQSFPDDFILEGNKKEQIMQIGNAVASRFAYHLGKHIINILR
jgi:DNA (cytosine-5)-methyltransferase 1